MIYGVASDESAGATYIFILARILKLFRDSSIKGGVWEYVYDDSQSRSLGPDTLEPAHLKLYFEAPRVYINSSRPREGGMKAVERDIRGKKFTTHESSSLKL